MSLSMYDLSTVFHMYDVHMITGSNANFESVTLLSENQMYFEKDILYICKRKIMPTLLYRWA